MHYEIKVLLDQTAPLENAGHWHSALHMFREAFRRSVQHRDIDNLIEAVLRSGFCLRQMGERDLATEYLELALVLAQLQGDNGRAARALNGLAALHHMHGEISTAEALYPEARKLALAAEDARTLGNIDQNLGVLAVYRGELTDALRHYQSALAYYRAVHHRGVAGVLNNLGMLHIDLGQLDRASSYLDEALSICRESSDVVTEGLVHLNRTELLLIRGELDGARTSCDAVYEIASQLRQHATISDALRFYGTIYREADKPYLAETHLREAIEVAVAHSYPLEEAEAQRELALVLRTQNRNKESLEALNRAHELVTVLQATQYQADIDRRITQLEADFASLVQAWGESIEAKDRYTNGHCQRVAHYACRIAECAGMPEREMIWFRMGSFLHDVGKTEIPESILNKPGRLTEEERLIIERHTVLGDEMLSSIEFPWDVRPMVRSHHERWDGRGYPDGLAAEDIPITARILHIADVFDALTTARSYRQPLTADEALQLMQDDHGSFDPGLFEIFRELFPEFKALVSASDTDVPIAVVPDSPSPGGHGGSR